MAEEFRLSFLERRDGLNSALNFAIRTMAIYRTAVLRSRKRGFANPHFASGPCYRKLFIESYCAFKKYIYEFENGEE